MADPNAPVVTEPQDVEAALADTLLATLGEEAAAPAPAPAPVPAPPPPAPRPGDSVLLQAGGWVAIHPGQVSPKFKPFRVTAVDGQALDHCDEDPVTGEWRYR